MNKYIDVKVTTWQRLHFKEDVDMQKLIQMLKEDTFPFDLCEDELGFEELEHLSECDEYIQPNENNNQSTVEVYEGNGYQKCIWNNQTYEDN